MENNFLGRRNLSSDSKLNKDWRMISMLSLCLIFMRFFNKLIVLYAGLLWDFLMPELLILKQLIYLQVLGMAFL